MLHFVVGAIVGLGFVLGGTYLEGGNFKFLFNVPALLITVGGTLGACWMAYSPNAIIRSLNTSLTGVGSDTHKREARRVWDLASRSLFTFGIIGFVIGLIHTAGNFSDWRTFGAGLATALLCPFYAYLIRALCVNPLRERVNTEESAENGQQNRHLRVA